MHWEAELDQSQNEGHVIRVNVQRTKAKRQAYDNIHTLCSVYTKLEFVHNILCTFILYLYYSLSIVWIKTMWLSQLLLSSMCMSKRG